MRYLGRKSRADRASCARSASCRPSERGPVGKAANEVRRGARGAARPAHAAELEATRARQPAGRGPHRRDAARRPAAARRPPAPDHPDAARDRGHLRRARLPGARGPRGRVRLLQLHRAQPPARPPGAAIAGHLLPLRAGAAAHAHLADADARDGVAAAADLHRRARAACTGATPDATHTPMFHQLEGLAIDEDITLARPPRRAARVRARDVRRASARCGCARATSRSPSRASRSTSPASAAAATGYVRDGSRCPLCKGTGWIEILGSGMVDPNVLGFVRDNGYDPERVQGFAFGMGIERIAMLTPRRAGPAHALRERPAAAGAVRRMRVPIVMAARVLRPRPRRPRRSPTR